MKPVNLLPSDAPVVKVSGAGPSLGMIGGVAASVVAVLAVGGYFAMSHVDSIKSETTAADTRAAQAIADTTATESLIQSVGTPVVDSDKQLAQGAEQVLVSAYAERHDFVQLAEELQGIMQGTGGWYDSVKASSGGSAATAGVEAGKDVTIVGYMPTEEKAASFEERVSATRTLNGAEITSLESVMLTDLDTKRDSTYWKFTITADLIDTIAPTTGDSGEGGAPSTGTTVGDGAGEEALTLSLDAKPKPKAAAKSPAASATPAATPAKPKNPFDLAASAASRGGGA